MNTYELERALKDITRKGAMEQALMKYVQQTKEVILELNKNQLFVDSEGADSKELGFYSMSEYNDLKKRAGEPFRMVDTGLFQKGMRIDVHYRHITIQSIFHTYEMQHNSDAGWLTLNWFGLTEPNFAYYKKNYTLPFLLEWLNEQMQKYTS